MKSLTTVTTDTSALLTLDEAKDWLRVEGTDEDVLISTILSGAVSYAENYLSKTIGNNTYSMSLDAFEDIIFLMRPPVASVTSINYVDADGNDQVLDLATTILDSNSGRLSIKYGSTFPSTAPQIAAVTIIYTCTGLYEAKEANDILDAIKLILTYRYDSRYDVSQRWKTASDNILAPLRIIPFG